MAKYGIQLISDCLDGMVTHRDGTPLLAPVPLDVYIDNTAGVEIYDHDEEGWKDIEFDDLMAAPSLTIAGVTMTAELIAGSHFNIRPK